MVYVPPCMKTHPGYDSICMDVLHVNRKQLHKSWFHPEFFILGGEAGGGWGVPKSYGSISSIWSVGNSVNILKSCGDGKLTSLRSWDPLRGGGVGTL